MVINLLIHNITRPLFGNIEGGSVKDLLLENVNIDMPGVDRVAPIANVIKIMQLLKTSK